MKCKVEGDVVLYHNGMRDVFCSSAIEHLWGDSLKWLVVWGQNIDTVDILVQNWTVAAFDQMVTSLLNSTILNTSGPAATDLFQLSKHK